MTVVLLFLGDNGWNSQVKLALINLKVYLLLLNFVVKNSKDCDFHLLVQENVENSRLRFEYFCLIMWLKHIFIYSVHFLIEK